MKIWPFSIFFPNALKRHLIDSDLLAASTGFRSSTSAASDQSLLPTGPTATSRNRHCPVLAICIESSRKKNTDSKISK